MRLPPKAAADPEAIEGQGARSLMMATQASAGATGLAELHSAMCACACVSEIGRIKEYYNFGEESDSPVSQGAFC